MTDYLDNRRGLLLADTRTGATLLSHLLDSHPQVFCTRGEILHKQNPTRKLIGNDHLASVRHALGTIGYRVNICKLTYGQWRDAFNYSIEGMDIDFIIHLKRANVLRSAVSDAIRYAYKDSHTHVYQTPEPMPIAVDVDEILMAIGIRASHASYVALMIEGWHKPFLNIEYEALADVDESGRLDWWNTEDFSKFLDVEPSHTLQTYTRPVNPLPLAELITNYDELAEALKNTPNEWMLE